MKKFRVRRIAQVMALGCCVVFLAAGAVSAQNDQQDMTVLPSSNMSMRVEMWLCVRNLRRKAKA